MYKVYVPAKRDDSVAAALEYDLALDIVGLLRELRYYCNKREAAGRPLPDGESRIQFDERLMLTLQKDGNTVRVMKAERG